MNITKSYKKTAHLVISNKLSIVFKEVKKYLNNDSVKNLHSARIAFRRLRYALEVFSECYKPKFYKSIYKKIVYMQDIIGTGRDLDVLEIKAKLIEIESGKKLPDFFYNKIKKEKEIISQEIRLELSKFITDKEVNKLIKKKKRG